MNVNMSAGAVARADSQAAKMTYTQLVVAARMAALKGREMLRARTATFIATGGFKMGIIDTGRYYRGWAVRRIPAGFSLYNRAPYADVIEFGRRPGAKPPPSKALIGWVMRNIGGGVTKETTKGGVFSTRVTKIKRTADSKVAGIAYVIARAIGRRGIKGKLVMFGIFDKLTAEYVKMGGVVAYNIVIGKRTK